jgi:hypothetical protein
MMVAKHAMCALIVCALHAGCDGGGIVAGDGSVPEQDAATAERDGGAPSHRERDAGAPVEETCSEPGALEEVSCGRCGTRSRFCTNASVWEYGPCEDELGECTPGDQRDGACGNCGTVRELCTEACAWIASGECSGERACAPGSLVRTSDGCSEGQRDLRCTDACEYEPASACTVDACESAGAIEMVSCGNCGTRRRFCTNELEWEYGPCGGERGCAPGSRSVEACGNCGEQELRCSESCEWLAFGDCSGEGECAPGSMTSSDEGCGSGLSRPMLCGDTCEYAPSGACTSGDALGQPCTDGSCGPGLVCDAYEGVATLCRKTCAISADCPSGTYCAGGGVCSDACDAFDGSGCPEGSACMPAGDYGGRLAGWCMPPGSGSLDAPCTIEDPTTCSPGLVCAWLDGGFIDVAVCQRPCDAAYPCTRSTCSYFDASTWGTCG